MKAATWLRLLAAIMVFFTVGHTMGVLNPPAEGVAGQALDAMRRMRFPIMGFERSYWDFYRGSAARSRVVSVALQHDGHHDSVTVTSESAADGVVQQSESGDEQPNDREEYSEPWFRSRCTLS